MTLIFNKGTSKEYTINYEVGRKLTWFTQIQRKIFLRLKNSQYFCFSLFTL